MRITPALSAAALVVAVGLAYAGSVHVPLLYDDIPAIVENPTLRHPADVLRVLWPPGAEAGTVGGRPLINLSLAINFLAGGVRPLGYHLVNVAIHAAAACLIFGWVRRTPWHAGAGRRERFAFAVALIWALHPLQTEAVAYTVQRAESLMGAFFLLAFYCFARSQVSPRAGRWLSFSVAACWCSAACKEVAVAAPVLMLLYDRTFFAGSFRRAWSLRRWYYGGLLASWVWIAVLVGSTGGRGGSAGFGNGISPGVYVLTQCRAIVTYLRLGLWPNRLVFDYGLALERHFSAVAEDGLLIAVLLAGTVFALWRAPKWGFLGAWFFCILAPSSSVVPIVTEPVAEHRMYLPLAALVAAGLAAASLAGRRMVWAVAVAAVVLGCLTVERVGVYRDPVRLWADTAAKVPGSARARNNLGTALADAGRPREAEAAYAAAVAVDPQYAPAHFNLGVALLGAGKPGPAVVEFDAAGSAPLHARERKRYLGAALFAWGNQLGEQGRFAEAAAAFRRAAEVSPATPELRNNLGNALFYSGRTAEAIDQYRQGLALRPNDPNLSRNLAEALSARR